MVKRRFVKEYLEPIIIAVLIALFIRTFVVQAFKIPSSSMEPTLLVGDYILVNKLIYGVRIPYWDKITGTDKDKKYNWKTPQRGDVIVFIYPEDRSKDFIKRVIATEGEKVLATTSRLDDFCCRLERRENMSKAIRQTVTIKATPHAQDFAKALEKGAVLLWVRADTAERQEAASDILRRCGGADVHTHKRAT